MKKPGFHSSMLELTIGCFAAVALWECLASQRRAQSAAWAVLCRRVSNLSFWLVNIMMVAAVGAPHGMRGLLPLPIDNPWLLGVSAFLVLDLAAYGVHRLKHVVPLLWRLHALHHTDPEVDWTTSVRHHPAEYAVTAAAYWGVFAIVDIPLTAAVVYAATNFVSAVVTHGNIRLPRWLQIALQPVFITRDLHWLHHSRVTLDSNYGSVLSVWDRLFGTLTLQPIADISFGVSELSPATRPVAMLLTPWRMR